ncbi:hypothetical protein FF011L_34050 [Roseimaritima multifibrata]|uniref:Uncharacterized protein n=1 Tax=Roseimaritima multifibrata TaxID=1930274 RepID=A0A517MIC2_9BACT|nr:hypothetical protein [Roseimaritima multifibrata]QDS94625.1 hypothetical protein FF011L_34050 [Roseimaritima multifibrata]
MLSFYELMDLTKQRPWHIGDLQKKSPKSIKQAALLRTIVLKQNK